MVGDRVEVWGQDKWRPGTIVELPDGPSRGTFYHTKRDDGAEGSGQDGAWVTLEEHIRPEKEKPMTLTEQVRRCLEAHPRASAATVISKLAKPGGAEVKAASVRALVWKIRKEKEKKEKSEKPKFAIGNIVQNSGIIGEVVGEKKGERYIIRRFDGKGHVAEGFFSESEPVGWFMDPSRNPWVNITGRDAGDGYQVGEKVHVSCSSIDGDGVILGQQDGHPLVGLYTHGGPPHHTTGKCCTVSRLSKPEKEKKKEEEKEIIKPARETKSANGWWRPNKEADFIGGLIRERRHVLIVGPAGTGKSLLAQYVCEEIGIDPIEYTMHRETNTDVFLGERTLEKDGEAVVTGYRDGILIRAMREGRALILNELNAATADIHFSIYRALENLSVTLPSTGESVRGQDGFFVLGTMNTLGYGDDSGMYVGTNLLNEAFRDRFDAVVKLDYLSSDAEKQLVCGETKMKARDAKLLVQYANRAREMMKAGKLASTFSTRKVLAMARAVMRGTPHAYALECSVLAKCPDSDATKLKEMAQRAFGKETK